MKDVPVSDTLLCIEPIVHVYSWLSTRIRMELLWMKNPCILSTHNEINMLNNILKQTQMFVSHTLVPHLRYLYVCTIIQAKKQWRCKCYSHHGNKVISCSHITWFVFVCCAFLVILHSPLKSYNIILSVTFIQSGKHAIDCVTNEEQRMAVI